MADSATNFPSQYTDILEKFADADGASASAVINGGRATTLNLHLSASEEDGQTVLSTQMKAETDGAKIFATSDAAGETAFTSLDLVAEVQEGELLETKVDAEAEATGDATDTGPTANTDVKVSPESAVVDFQEGDTLVDNTAESFTSLEAIFEQLPTIGDNPIAIDTGVAGDWPLL